MSWQSLRDVNGKYVPWAYLLALFFHHVSFEFVFWAGAVQVTVNLTLRRSLVFCLNWFANWLFRYIVLHRDHRISEIWPWAASANVISGIKLGTPPPKKKKHCVRRPWAEVEEIQTKKDTLTGVHRLCLNSGGNYHVGMVCHCLTCIVKTYLFLGYKLVALHSQPFAAKSWKT